MKDNLGDRMKDHENCFRYHLPKKAYTLIRCDGKAFHSYTKGFARPFDIGLITVMQRTTEELCKQTNAIFGYTQSDEITLVLSDFENRDTQAWFDSNLQKICSITSSIATAEFNRRMMILKNSFEIKSANFDSRVWSLSDPWEVFNTFLWRQNDASRNSVQMVAQSLYSHKELQGKKFKDLQEMIFQKGQNWNDLPTYLKRGTFIYKENDSWKIDMDAPILTQDKNWVFKKLPLIQQPAKIEESP